MEVYLHKVPEEKKLEDYPEGTEFILDDRPKKIDKKALEENKLVFVYPDDPGYDEALTYEEAIRIYG